MFSVGSGVHPENINWESQKVVAYFAEDSLGDGDETSMFGFLASEDLGTTEGEDNEVIPPGFEIPIPPYYVQPPPYYVPSPAPEPATMFILGPALLGIFGLLRKRRER
jgi:hypothetical protein